MFIFFEDLSLFLRFAGQFDQKGFVWFCGWPLERHSTQKGEFVNAHPAGHRIVVMYATVAAAEAASDIGVFAVQVSLVQRAVPNGILGFDTVTAREPLRYNFECCY